MVADFFHYCHVNFLRQTKTHGDSLLAVVLPDETVESLTQLASLHQTVSCTYELNPRDKKLPNKVLKNRYHTQRFFRGLLKLLPVTPQLVYGSRLSVELLSNVVYGHIESSGDLMM